MQNVTVFTKRYSMDLSKYLILNKINYDCYEKSGLMIFNVPVATLYLKSFLQLLQNFVLEQNPIVKRSQRLKNTLFNLIFTQTGDIMHDLQSTVLENDSVNLDGYVDFRLQDYSHMVDKILYAVIKKNINTQLLLQEY